MTWKHTGSYCGYNYRKGQRQPGPVPEFVPIPPSIEQASELGAMAHEAAMQGYDWLAERFMAKRQRVLNELDLAGVA
jgi:hypothetical protein